MRINSCNPQAWILTEQCVISNVRSDKWLQFNFFFVLQRVMFAKSQEKGILTTNCNLSYLFVTQFQEPYNVIVCHKQSEDHGVSLENLDI